MVEATPPTLPQPEPLVTSCAILVCLFLAGGFPPAQPMSFAELVARPDPARPIGAGRPVAGAIEGKVTVRERPARRMPSRYPAGGGGARPVQRIPAIVYLEGSLPGAARAAANEMAQQDTAFAPAVLVVRPGSEVSFPNRDPFFHNVFSYSTTQRFDLGRYPRGEAKTVRFSEPGAVKIYCEVHESMRAAVIVTENPFYVVLGPDGAFRLDGVPAGVHRLAVWHVDLGTETQEVRVPDGGTARVEITIG
jgi:plastocyanin